MLQRSIRLDATSSVPFILMGKVLQKKGDYDLAVLSLKHAVTMEPNNPTTHYLLGQTYREMGNKEDAEAELKRAQELHGQEDLQ
jgi:Flp pilus assembly protein TadD